MQMGEIYNLKYISYCSKTITVVGKVGYCKDVYNTLLYLFPYKPLQTRRPNRLASMHACMHDGSNDAVC